MKPPFLIPGHTEEGTNEVTETVERVEEADGIGIGHEPAETGDSVLMSGESRWGDVTPFWIIREAPDGCRTKPSRNLADIVRPRRANQELYSAL
ncbi:hypothetical protein ACIQTT_10450 [Microbacterium sp. NPDC090225]|uniref:hypothetical protein n=1 Tax=Microbacterium sp. NPDC090225 TaxID=3364207 RepID=UPI00381CB148